jgi:hypothetical protein
MGGVGGPGGGTSPSNQGPKSPFQARGRGGQGASHSVTDRATRQIPCTEVHIDEPVDALGRDATQERSVLGVSKVAGILTIIANGMPSSRTEHHPHTKMTVSAAVGCVAGGR